MKKAPREPLKTPFDFTLTIHVSGITRSDGVITLTPRMLIDKITAPVDHALAENLIRDYSIDVKINNLEEAKALLDKSKKPY